MFTNLSTIGLQNQSPLDISTQFASIYINTIFYEKIPQKNYADHWQNWTFPKLFAHSCQEIFANVQFCL